MDSKIVCLYILKATTDTYRTESLEVMTVFNTTCIKTFSILSIFNNSKYEHDQFRLYKDKCRNILIMSVIMVYNYLKV